MGLRMESCRPWWCCRGSAPPPPGTGTGTALGPGGWPRLCRDGSPGGGGGLSSSAGLDDEWSGVPDGVFSSSELPSTDLPLPFSDAASGLWLLEFSLFSLQMQEQSSRVNGGNRGRSAPPRQPEPDPATRLRARAARRCLRVFLVSTIFSAWPGALALSASSLNRSIQDFSLLSFSPCRLYPPTSSVLNLLNIFPVLCTLWPPPPFTEFLTFLCQRRGAQGAAQWSWGRRQGEREDAWIFRFLAPRARVAQ